MFDDNFLVLIFFPPHVLMIMLVACFLHLFLNQGPESTADGDDAVFFFSVYMY